MSPGPGGLTSVHCGSCGTQIGSDAKFCPSCGNSVNAPAARPQGSSTRPARGTQPLGSGPAAGSAQERVPRDKLAGFLSDALASRILDAPIDKSGLVDYVSLYKQIIVGRVYLYKNVKTGRLTATVGKKSALVRQSRKIAEIGGKQLLVTVSVSFFLACFTFSIVAPDQPQNSGVSVSKSEGTSNGMAGTSSSGRSGIADNHEKQWYSKTSTVFATTEENLETYQMLARDRDKAAIERMETQSRIFVFGVPMRLNQAYDGLRVGNVPMRVPGETAVFWVNMDELELR